MKEDSPVNWWETPKPGNANGGRDWERRVVQGIAQKGVHPKSKDGTKGAKKKIVELWCTGASYEANQAT